MIEFGFFVAIVAIVAALNLGAFSLSWAIRDATKRAEMMLKKYEEIKKMGIEEANRRTAYYKRGPF